jgi:transcription elongation factor GreA
MTMKPVYVTPKGLTDLEHELEEKRAKRAEVVERLHEAKEGSDWMDNSEYRLIEDELGFMEGRIQELENMLAAAQVIKPDEDDSTVNLGDKVVIQADGELEEYTIVGVAESAPRRGFISNESPLGRALLNRQVGEEVEVQAPDGSFYVRIMAVRCGMQEADGNPVRDAS